MAEDSAKLREEVETLKSDISSLTQTIKELTEERIKEKKTKLLDELNLDELKSRLDELKNKGKDGIDSVENEISQKPLQSVAISFGIGALVGLFLSRK
ncbi:MAG: YqjD family protein [Campylobacterales bacterium]